MQILITGSDGFIASSIIPKLLYQGHHVIGVDDHTRYGNITRPYHTHPAFENYVYDVKNIRDIECEPLDLIVHCAYDIGGILHWNHHHKLFYQRNHPISQAMIEYVTQNDCRHVIWMSSSQVYENDTEFPSSEHLATVPTSGYGREKLDAENLCLQSSHADRFCILRPFNCIGAGELYTPNRSNHVAVDIARKIIQSQGTNPITLYGDGSQVRSFTVVDDFSDAVMQAIDHQHTGVFNVCGSHTMTITELARRMWRLRYDTEPLIELDHHQLDHDVGYRQGTDNKFRTITGWHEHHDLDDCLLEIINCSDIH